MPFLWHICIVTVVLNKYICNISFTWFKYSVIYIFLKGCKLLFEVLVMHYAIYGNCGGKKKYIVWYGVKVTVILMMAHTLCLMCLRREPKVQAVVFTQLGFFLWGSPSLLRGKSLMLFLLSVVVPEHNNCTAFLCFPHLPPLSRLKATDFVWLYKNRVRHVFIPVLFWLIFLFGFCYVHPNVKCTTLWAKFPLWNTLAKQTEIKNRFSNG